MYIASEINFSSFAYIWLNKGNQYEFRKNPKINGLTNTPSKH